MRRSRFTLAIVAAAVGATQARTQVITGTATDRATATAIAGAIVSLMQDGPARIAPTLANERGRYAVRAPAAGQYHIRAEAVGYAAFNSAPFTAGIGDTVRIDAVLVAQRNMLAPVQVIGTTTCHTDPQTGERTAAVWDEIRKALSSSDVGDRERRTEFELVEVRRVLTSDRATLSERSITSRAYAPQSYGSHPAEVLARTGYAVEIADSVEYYGPDAPLLLSPIFLSTHCFSRVDRKPFFGSREVGLRFAPLADHLRSDISGTMWLDAATSALKRIEFAYEIPFWPSHTQTAHGEVLYERTPNGQWYVNRWEMNMPVLSVQQNLGMTIARVSSWHVKIGTAKPLESPASPDLATR